ncbi:hypothetical protein SPRG_10419 [Saprolegnia parasitica CBS 223.65]|uniref:Uncharacterized protein n=1 Tax=Saprolegnia parasitica (strain CBS 223.65) TaxID=695850 RepID=A0A067CBZ7_SAPPC|nr:hypothetical protein SPRG_10419 [Saprolegnia parasitica CBS 223.65]KDO24342.1 hypothetical protein SPRG_10419 [Saprolegnia parasitica CBS 223.65]|eukprot:XP_012204937.1 hypothetical protein SPRG_10419 [Saprolegnia parasitica CBS 223.65]
MGSGCSTPTKPVLEWRPTDVSDFAAQAIADEATRHLVVQWIAANDVSGSQLIDMEPSMVVTALQLHGPTTEMVTQLILDIKQRAAQEAMAPEIRTTLKDLPAALEKAVYVYEKYPLVVDHTGGQAAQFFKYQRGCFLLAGNPLDMTEASLRRHLVAALRLGSLMTICFDKLTGVELDTYFLDGAFPHHVLDRAEFFKPEVWSTLLRKDEGDPEPNLFLPCDAFKFALLYGAVAPPPRTRQRMCLVSVLPPDALAAADDGDDPVASALGLKEVRRNSVDVVEAGFDGDIAALDSWLEKGYHLESEDGHKHTALSEAACQGHDEMIAHLLALGANPNARNDAGRSPLFRAAYNGHLNAVLALLHAGGDPRCTTQQGERAFDVAKTKDIAAVLSEWNVETTETLLRERYEKKLQERLTSHVEREQVAMMRIHQDLIATASSTASAAAEALKEKLAALASEAVDTETRPRGTADVRDERGATLLALAAQYDNAESAHMLLSFWKSFQDDNHPMLRAHKRATAVQDVYTKVFKPNVNARDAKGWTPIAIAIFHQSKRVARLLLHHGANPRLKNQYNKDAFDLAQDEIDAALNVVTSKAEIRSVLVDWESAQLQSTLENQRCKGAAPIDPLPADGGATLLAIEQTTARA